MSKNRRLTRNNLPFTDIVFLYLSTRKHNLRTITDNTMINARDIIRDPVNFTHFDDKYSTQQSRNHMHDCRSRLKCYWTKVDRLNEEFQIIYPNVDDRIYMMNLARDFIASKERERYKRKNEQY